MLQIVKLHGYQITLL